MNQSEFFNTADKIITVRSTASMISEIVELKKQFPNDQELGYEVRKLINQWKDEDVRGSFK